MIRFIYNFLWPIGLLLFLPGYLVKMFRRGGYREKFGQRLGFYGTDVRRRFENQRPIWLHAVSVGEVAIALKLADKLRALMPELQIALTTTTTTGFAFARANAAPWIEVMYSPLDFWPVVRSAFATIRPERIALVEAEVWPNLVVEARKRAVPIALVNARLSPRSERRFKRFVFIVRPMFRALDLVCVQKSEDAARWAGLGVDPERIRVTGSIKYDSSDVRASDSLPAEAAGWIGRSAGASAARTDAKSTGGEADRLIFFGGSTHSGEEEALGRVFVSLRTQFPSLMLFVAPRHVERARLVRKQLEALNLSVRLTSEPAESVDCVVLDRTGELQQWYRIATVAFIGKSLKAHGGQNPVEPILVGVPVIFGPHMENFAALADALVANRGAIRVDDVKELEEAVAKLLRGSESRKASVANAEAVIAQDRGATERTARLFVDLASH